MKKIVALLLSISMMAGIAAACKKSESTTESTTESMGTDQSIEVTTEDTSASESEPEGTKPEADPDAGTRATPEVADGAYAMDEAFNRMENWSRRSSPSAARSIPASCTSMVYLF